MRARRLALVRDLQETRDMSQALRVAFATSDRKCVDQHFGSATSFAIYAVDENASRFVEAVEFAPEAQDGNESKLAGRIAALEGCDAVFVRAVGASAVMQLLRRGVYPQKAAPGAPIKLMIARLQRMIASDRPAWMRQALLAKQHSAERFDAMEEEGWSDGGWDE